jgi:hypothetical protein
MVNHSSSPLSSLVLPVLNTTDQNVLQTLEGHILPLLPASPSYIHNIHLKVTILPEHYVELSLPILAGNKGKKTTQIIGTSKVDYTFYPNGTINVEVTCSNNPFRLYTEEDRSRLLVHFGQLRQALISIVSDRHELIVPNVMEWEFLSTPTGVVDRGNASSAVLRSSLVINIDWIDSANSNPISYSEREIS